MPLEQSILDSQDYKDAVASAISAATSPLQTSLNNLESNNQNLVNEKKVITTQFKDFKAKYDGIDVEALQERLAQVDNDEVRQLLAKGEYDKVYERQTAALQADHDSQLAAQKKIGDDAAELASTLQSTLVLQVRDNGISQAFVAKDADKSQLRSVLAIAKDTVLVGNEYQQVVSVDNSGSTVFRHSTTGKVLQNAEGNFNYQDWLAHLAGEEGIPLFAKPNSHSSPHVMTKNNPKGFVKSKMSATEKQEFKREHGIANYDALPYS